MKKIIRVLAALLCIVLMSTSVTAHPGRTDASGGHHDYKIEAAWEVIIIIVDEIRLIFIREVSVHMAIIQRLPSLLIHLHLPV